MDCSGHSLGGALASLMAHSLAHKYVFVLCGLQFSPFHFNLRGITQSLIPFTRDDDRYPTLAKANRLHMYSFGAPRVGNKEFCEVRVFSCVV